jgi:hypothetical protein
MDLSFTRRRKGTKVAGTSDLPGTPNLQSLLSAAAARQSASPTARAAAATDSEPSIVSLDDPRIGLFAGDLPQSGPASSASFSKISDQPINPRQRS